MATGPSSESRPWNLKENVDMLLCLNSFEDKDYEALDRVLQMLKLLFSKEELLCNNATFSNGMRVSISGGCVARSGHCL